MPSPLRRRLIPATLTLCALASFTTVLSAQAVDRGTLTETVDSLVAAYLAEGPVAGVAVAVEKDGEVILAKGYGLAEIEHNVPVTVETVFRLGSISKQFTAVAILQLAEQGKLRLDDPLTQFVPDYPTEGHEVTIHHLLTHTSGIANYTALGPAFWSRSRLDISHQELVDLFSAEPFDFAPGEEWRYSNSGYYLLGMIVEVAAGDPIVSLAPRPAPAVVGGAIGAPAFGPGFSVPRPAPIPFGEYVATHIFRPLGMTGSSYCDETAIVPHRAQGYERSEGRLVNDEPIGMSQPGAAGALCSTVLDLLRWQRALDSNTLISAESRQRMLEEATLNDGSKTGYGYGLGIGDFEGHRMVSHGGGINGFNTQLATYPDDDLVVVVLANTNGAAPGRLEKQITRLMFGLPLEVTLDLPTDGVDLQALTGTYTFTEVGLTARVTVRDEALWVEAEGLGEVRLKYQGENRFILLPGQSIVFFPDGDPPSAELQAGGTRLQGTREPPGT